jgi:hypothetical protein
VLPPVRPDPASPSGRPWPDRAWQAYFHALVRPRPSSWGNEGDPGRLGRQASPSRKISRLEIVGLGPQLSRGARSTATRANTNISVCTDSYPVLGLGPPSTSRTEAQELNGGREGTTLISSGYLSFEPQRPTTVWRSVLSATADLLVAFSPAPMAHRVLELMYICTLDVLSHVLRVYLSCMSGETANASLDHGTSFASASVFCSSGLTCAVPGVQVGR